MVLVEHVPVREPAVAGQIDLSGADSADGHADGVEVGAAEPLGFTLREQGADPLGLEPFLDRDEVVRGQAHLALPSLGASAQQPTKAERERTRRHLAKEAATREAGRKQRRELGERGARRVHVFARVYRGPARLPE